MPKAKFELTSEFKINAFGVKVFRIKALVDIETRGIKKGDLGGFVEKEDNLSGNAWVSGNAEVSGDARVSGDAHLKAKAGFAKGWFIGGDDTGKITEITDKTGSNFWKKQYVLGDFEIKDLSEEK